VKITVKAKTGRSETSVKQIDECTYEVSVSAQPEKGLANKAIIDALANYFKIPKSNINILAGHAAKSKIIEILS